MSDNVKGPDKLDTEEQMRTRNTHSFEEREEDRARRTDPELSTLQQNLRGAGVDDRGVEDGPIGLDGEGERPLESG